MMSSQVDFGQPAMRPMHPMHPMRFFSAVIIGSVVGWVAAAVCDIAFGMQSQNAVLVGCVLGGVATLLALFWPTRPRRDERHDRAISPLLASHRPFGGFTRKAFQRATVPTNRPGSQGQVILHLAQPRPTVAKVARVENVTPLPDPPVERSWLGRLADWLRRISRRLLRRGSLGDDSIAVDASSRGIFPPHRGAVPARRKPDNTGVSTAGPIRRVEIDMDVCRDHPTVVPNRSASVAVPARRVTWWDVSEDETTDGPTRPASNARRTHAQAVNAPSTVVDGKNSKNTGQPCQVATLSKPDACRETPRSPAQHAPYLFVGKFIRVRRPNPGAVPRG